MPKKPIGSKPHKTPTKKTVAKKTPVKKGKTKSATAHSQNANKKPSGLVQRLREFGVEHLPTETPNASKSKPERPERKESNTPLTEFLDSRSPLQFPVEAFPTDIKEYVESVAKAFRVPIDFPACWLLGVVAGCAGKRCSIEINEVWTHFPVVWPVIVARSGTRKTPTLKEMLKPVKAIQRELREKYDAERKVYDNLKKEDKQDAEEPRREQIRLTDTTVEALRNVFEINEMGVILAADELMDWVKSWSQYKGGKGNDRAVWLAIWGNVDFTINRAGKKDPIDVEDPMCIVLEGIQPGMVEDVIKDGIEDGCAARLLISYPEELSLEERKSTKAKVVKQETYARICNSLYKLKTRKTHQMDKAAERLFTKQQDSLQHELDEVGDDLRPFFSKCEGYIGALALILFLLRKECGETSATKVDIASMEGAIRIVEYFKAHARKVYATVETYSSDKLQEKVFKYVSAQHGTVEAYQVCQNVSGIKNADHAKAVLTCLAQDGYGKITEGERNRRSFTFTLEDWYLDEIRARLNSETPI